MPLVISDSNADRYMIAKSEQVLTGLAPDIAASAAAVAVAVAVAPYFSLGLDSARGELKSIPLFKSESFVGTRS